MAQMVGWLYINDEVAAPVRMLETDERSGVLTIEVAARFVPNRTMLRGETIVEFKGWSERRLVRCLGAERVAHALMIEAVDIGPANDVDDTDHNPQGLAEDWLTVDGQAHCRVTGLRMDDRSGQGHCLFHVDLIDWRDLRIGENAPLACVGIQFEPGQDNDGSITPMLHSARELPLLHRPPQVEIVRLRERQRLTVQPIATDWGDETTLVVARVLQVASLNGASEQTPVAAG